MQVNDIPKVILHEHIEGSVTPKLATILALRHNTVLPDNFLYADGCYDRNQFPDGRYAYDESDFNAFIATYDLVAGLIRTPGDYYLVVKDFLSRNAKQGLVYCELIASPFHMSQLNGDNIMNAERYHQVMDAIEKAIDEARHEFGVETRLHAVGIRHLGPEHVNQVVDFIDENPRDSITGFNIAGNENAGNFADFANAYQKLNKLKLGRSYHAGEINSSISVEQALDAGAMRIGHGVRSIDNPKTIQRLIEQNITLEVAITSNLILIKDFAVSPNEHPVRALYDAGVRITLNTDDAGIFGTTIAKEYQLAAGQFGFNRIELLDISLCAVEAAFVDDQTKQRLIQKIYRNFNSADIAALKEWIPHIPNPYLKDRIEQRYQQAKKYHSQGAIDD